MSQETASEVDPLAAKEHGKATDSAARLAVYAYAALALGLVVYIIAIWFQVFIDTHKARAVAPDAYFEGHRHWRMRTALVFLIWSVLGGLTLPFAIGWFVLIPAYIWYAYRVVKGIACLSLGRSPYPARARHADCNAP